MDAALDDRTLRRIAAVPVSLAVLAEQAAVRSFPVRVVLLCILRHAEAIAASFVAAATGTDWPPFDEDPEAGCRPADAIVLALLLRALAALVFAMINPRNGDSGRTAVGNPRTLASCTNRRHFAPDGWIFGRLDTS